MAQALFNPESHPPVSADVVVADFIDECLPIPRGGRYLIYYCRTCWAAKNKFKNSL